MVGGESVASSDVRGMRVTSSPEKSCDGDETAARLRELYVDFIFVVVRWDKVLGRSRIGLGEILGRVSL